MPMLAQFIPLFSAASVLLALGAVGLYVASRAGVDALVGRDDRAAPGRRAVGQWVPAAATAVAAVFAGRADLAVGVAFGSAVAALALAGGMVTYASPPGVLPASRRAWPFVLAAALLVLVAGFSGHLKPSHALMLLVLGAAVLAVWRGADEPSGVAHLLGEYAGPAESPPTAWLRALQGVFAVVVAAAGARAVVGGAVATDNTSRLFRAGLLAAGVLSPLLILPTLSAGTDLAHRGRSAEAFGSLVGLALLNLCGLLPVLILLWYVRSAVPGGGGAVALLRRLVEQGEPLPLPLAVWRIDVVILVLLGFALVPISLGRWALGRLESAGLVFTYAAYLAATARVSVRM